MATLKERIHAHHIRTNAHHKGPNLLSLRHESISGEEFHETFRGIDLVGAHFKYCDFRNADFRDTSLRGTSFLACELREAEFLIAYMRGVRFIGCDLKGANLNHSDLSGAFFSQTNINDCHLWDVTGNNQEIKNISHLPLWRIVYTARDLQIGCRRYRIADWHKFSDAEISAMDIDALDWWKEYKEEIFSVIERFPAIPTGFE
tara:strand:+ start:1493 stop:2101 length:609 start_codon:yes stop_codon:yes gene_type:complete